jgi:hypothetical protein
VLKISQNLGKAFNTEDTEEFNKTNHAIAKPAPFVIGRTKIEYAEATPLVNT